MDELLISTDLVVGSDPALTDEEVVARVLSMFASHDPEDTAPEPECVLAFVRGVRELHLFG